MTDNPITAWHAATQQAGREMVGKVFNQDVRSCIVECLDTLCEQAQTGASIELGVFRFRRCTLGDSAIYIDYCGQYLTVFESAQQLIAL